MKLISIGLLSCILLLGCSTKQPDVIYSTKYQEVKVPVVYNLQRPNRPVYQTTDAVPVYLLKILEYTSALEVIIDEYSEKGLMNV